MTSLWDDLLPDPGPCSLSLEVSCIANMPLCTGVCLLPLSVPECTMPCMHCIASGAYDSSLQRHIRDAIQIKMSHGHSALIVRWMQLMTHCTDCKRSWCYLWRLVYPTIDTTRPRCVVKDFFPFPHRTIALVLPCHVPDIKHIISLVYCAFAQRTFAKQRTFVHRSLKRKWKKKIFRSHIIFFFTQNQIEFFSKHDKNKGWNLHTKEILE